MREDQFFAYLAGFLDADGSIYVRLKPNSSYKYDFQVSPYVVFFQSASAKVGLEVIQQKLEYGYLRQRKDGIVEYTIGDRSSIRLLINCVLPFLILKKKQADLMIKILDQADQIESAKDFIKLAELIDKFSELNYSKKRRITSRVVRRHLAEKERTLTP